jgi:TonB family protein
MLDSTLKVSVIVALALTANALLRSRSAALRHWVLAAAVACALAIPVIGLLVPGWELPLERPQRLQADRHATLRANEPAASERVAPGPVLITSWAAPRHTVSRVTIATALAWLSWVWMAGAVISLGVLLAGLLRLTRLASCAEPLENARWQSTATALAREHGVRRRIRLLAGVHPALLVTWGFWRPIVLVPASAASWPADRVRAVLGHEIAHIQRHDWLILIAAEALRAFYWCNPFVWIACRRLRQESEQACDDAVLSGGVEASVYASHLLDVARSFGRHRRSWLPAPAILRPSSLERRIGAMLNPGLNHRPVTRGARIATMVAALALTAGVAGFQAVAQTFGSVSGSVVDSTNRTISGATLVLTGAPNQAKQELRSDADGHFEFVGLPQGGYRLEASVPGFAPFRADIIVAAARPQQQIVTLQVGSLMETVTVWGGSSPAPFVDPPWHDDTSGCVPAASGGTIRQPIHIRNDRPVYPAQLHQTKVEGHVVLDARIGTDGSIRDVRVVAPGHPDFDSAALEAVRQWRFSQTLLNCVPVEVSMTVHVNFVPQR